ncbi:MAG: hypothetical protein ACNYVW_02295 [Methanosarcinales archaeon]
MKMDYSPSTEGILKRILGSGYQIHPDALKILESLGEEKAISVLGTFPDKFPELIVIEVKHVEGFLEKAQVKKSDGNK